MVEECTETSIATSLGMPNWWPDLHANSLSSWGSNSNTNNSPWQTQNPNSNSSGDEDVSISTSFTNASNQSGLTVESSRRGLVESAPANELIGETGSGNQLWNHVLLGNQEVSESAIGMISSSKGLSTGMFAPSACSDYLKKIESSWEFMPPSSLNNFEKQFNDNSLFENQRLTKLSNLVSDWSIAPPDHFNMPRFSQSDMISQMKQKIMDRSSGDSFPCYNNPHDMKVKDEHESIETLPGTLFGQLLSSGHGMDYQLGLKNSILGDDDNKYYYGMQSVANACPSTRSFADVISFNGLLNKPLLDSIQPTPPAYRSSSNLSDCKKPGTQASSRLTVPTSQTVPRKSQGHTSEGKKKRSEEKSETPLKKAKLESSATKVQVPKVKVADKVTALQQIVSPFGKTDTASVLGEAIGYIKFLQEQVQLLSNPYMKTTITKDPWGGLDRKDEFDLKSRGLCLVPISCTPQVYRDNTGSDYWTPTYRGCLYR